jgi:hypothetical protein
MTAITKGGPRGILKSAPSQACNQAEDAEESKEKKQFNPSSCHGFALTEGSPLASPGGNSPEPEFCPLL